MESCIYEGRVQHRRREPVEHRFEYPLFMMYLDLEELPRLFEGRWLWSTKRPALARFRREDYLGDPALPLDQAVRDLVEERTGRRPEGPVRMLTHLRYLGFVINPVSLYYCFDEQGQELQAVVAEVTNTPWNQRHSYVLTPDSPGPMHRFTIQKEFHVSPFMSMDAVYRWAIRRPGRHLALRIGNDVDGGRQRIFDAALSLHRVELSGRSMARALLRYPLMTAQVAIGIYWEAFRLYRKKAPFFSNPGQLAPVQSQAGPQRPLNPSLVVSSERREGRTKRETRRNTMTRATTTLIAIALLATFAWLTPAFADGHLATVTVIHGIDGRDLGADKDLPVDVFVEGVGCALTDFRFGDISPRLELPEGT